MKKMDVAFCVNNAYIEKVAVVMVSMLANHPDDYFRFYIFSSDLTDESIKYLNKLHSKYKNFEVSKVEVPVDLFKSLKLSIDYISIEAYYRYAIAELLPDLDKILYIDADLVINGDINQFYDMDVSDYYVAGVEDLWIKLENHKTEIGLTEYDIYINSGVLLMNLQKFRQDGMCQKLIKATQDLWDKIKYQDQDILNIMCKGKIKQVDSIYNFTRANMKAEQNKLKNACILHYTGRQKPWMPRKLKIGHVIQFWKRDRYFYADSVWDKYAALAVKILNSKIKVGLLIDEFFGGAGTAFGGYGFLARKYIAKYIPNEDIQIDVLLGKSKWKFFPQKFHVDDVDLYRLPRQKSLAKKFLKKQNYDMYLSIELTSDFVLKHETDENKKLLLWIQDPRPQYEWQEIETVKLYKEENYYNQKIYDLVHNWYKQGRVTFVSQGYFLNPKAIDLYNLEPDTPIKYMPNPVDIDIDFDVSTYNKKDNIIFLGRIESVKRGWLFCEIAKRMPEYNFYMLGQSFREKDKNTAIMAKYYDIPNLHFAGHVDGQEKEQYLKDAKILVNTSIHEALPVSFLEALAYGVCLVSNRNPEYLTEKFGIWTGQINGDGFDKVDLYVNAIKQLMSDENRRQKLAEDGRKYVEKVHNVSRFINDLRSEIHQVSGK